MLQPQRVPTCSSPVVRVPVLSNTRTLALAAVSKAFPLLKKTPLAAAAAVAAATAAGTARPIAQGQAAQQTATPNRKANRMPSHTRAQLESLQAAAAAAAAEEETEGAVGTDGRRPAEGESDGIKKWPCMSL